MMNQPMFGVQGNQRQAADMLNPRPVQARNPYSQQQSGMAQAAPNNFGFQRQAGMQNAQAGMAMQNAQQNMARQQSQLYRIPSGATQAAASASPFPSQMAQAAPQNPYAMQAAQQNYNALQGAYSQQQSGMAQAAPNNFGFQQQAVPYDVQGALQNAQTSMAQQQQLYGVPSAITSAASSAYPFPTAAARAAAQNPYAMQAAFNTASASQAAPQPISMGQPMAQAAPSRSLPPGAYGVF